MSVFALCFAATAAELKHMQIATSDHVQVYLAATSIETDSTPGQASVVHLKENVEIRMRWAEASPERLVIHADSAEFHEDTGQVEAHGNVTMTPVAEPEAEEKSAH